MGRYGAQSLVGKIFLKVVFRKSTKSPSSRKTFQSTRQEAQDFMDGKGFKSKVSTQTLVTCIHVL